MNIHRQDIWVKAHQTLCDRTRGHDQDDARHHYDKEALFAITTSGERAYSIFRVDIDGDEVHADELHLSPDAAVAFARFILGTEGGQ